MGCWNGTCGISRLPIHHRSPVRMVLLKRREQFNNIGSLVGFCETHYLMTPVLFPLVGQYDDYGSIENVQDSYTLRQLRELSGIDDASNLMKELERGNVYVPATHPQFKFLTSDKNATQKANLGFMLILEEVYQYILTSIRADDDMFGYPRILEKAENFKRDVATTTNSDTFFLKDFVTDFVGFNSDWETIDVRKYLLSKPDDFESVVQDIIDFHCLRYFMNQCRIGFMEQFGGGSQTDAFDLHKGLAKKSIEIMEKKEREWNE